MALHSYKPVTALQPAATLPFVSGDPLRAGSCWSAKPTGDYGRDFERGEALAAQYIAFVRAGNGTSLPGGLMQIASSMAKRGALDQRQAGDGCGVAAGFLAAIDLALRQITSADAAVPVTA